MLQQLHASRDGYVQTTPLQHAFVSPASAICLQKQITRCCISWAAAWEAGAHCVCTMGVHAAAEASSISKGLLSPGMCLSWVCCRHPSRRTSIALEAWLTSSTVLQVAVVLHVGQQRAVPAVVQPVLLLDAAGHHAHCAHGHVLLLHDHGVCLLLLPHWHHRNLRCVLMLIGNIIQFTS